MKTLLKWSGGRVAQAPTIVQRFPTRLTGDYIEPFVGGCSVLLEFLRTLREGTRTLSGRIICMDKNPSLINFLQHVQSNPGLVADEFHALGDLGSRDDYQVVRDEFNHLFGRVGYRAAAIFLFLNRAGFRGMFRESAEGNFNVPFGNNEGRPGPSHRAIMEFSDLVQDVEFRVQDWAGLAPLNLHWDDFLFLDPPPNLKIRIHDIPCQWVKYENN